MPVEIPGCFREGRPFDLGFVSWKQSLTSTFTISGIAGHGCGLEFPPFSSGDVNQRLTPMHSQPKQKSNKDEAEKLIGTIFSKSGVS